MNKYEDFDLDMKVTNEVGSENRRTTTIIIESIVEGCTDKCTNYCTKFCSNGCPTPTKNRPATSCHLKNINGVQARC